MQIEPSLDGVKGTADSEASHREDEVQYPAKHLRETKWVTTWIFEQRVCVRA